MKSSNTEPQVICILGMHRSGTSLISRIISLLGVYLGSEDNLMRPAPDNPRGFWENQQLTDINDEILARLGGSWHEIPAFSENWGSDPELADIRQKARTFLQEEFASASFWGWKDPRTCLTLPFWQKLLPRLRFIICLRNPVDVARSLERRDGFSFEKSVHLWLTYVKSALEHTAEQPRLFVFYEDIMAAWPHELERLRNFLEQPDFAERPEIQRFIKESIDTELHHHKTSIAESVDDPGVSFYAKALFMLLRAYYPSRAESDQREPRQDLREAIDRLSLYAFSAHNEKKTLAQRVAILTEQQQRSSELEQQLSQLITDKSGLVGQFSQLQAALESRDKSLGDMEQQLSQLITDKSGLLGQSSQLQAALESRDKSLGDMEQRLNQLTTENTNLLGQSSQLQAALESRDKSLLGREKVSQEMSEALNRIYASHGWKALSLYYRVRNWMFPPGSKRRRLARLLFHAVQGSRFDFSEEETIGNASAPRFFQDFDGSADSGREAIAACTIVSKNYLAFARTLADSFHKFHPDVPFFVLLVDRIDGCFRPEEEKFHLVGLDDLNIPDLEEVCFKYTILNLNTAVKPYFLSHLLDKHQIKKLVYLDPDILITDNLSPLFNLLHQHAIVITPHITVPFDDNRYPGDLDILQAGVYNLGFIAISDRPITRRFLTWWAQKLYEGALMAHEKGMHNDQRWVDLVPSLFDDVCILKQPGYNVAYWNLHSRDIDITSQKVLVNHEPCYFVHFSGFDPGDTTTVSKHQNRFFMKDIGQSAQLFKQYSEFVLANGYHITRTWPYAFDNFDNGVKIPSVARHMYHSLGEKRARFGNPFSTQSLNCYFNWLNEPAEGSGHSGIIISRLWKEIYSLRPDLQAAFPDIFGAHRQGFFHWITNGGWPEIDECFVPRATDVIAPTADRKATPSLAPRLYFHLLRPLESAFKPVLKRTIGRNERLWTRLKEARHHLTYAYHLTAYPSTDTISTHSGDGGKPFGINLAGYFRSEKGVGEAGRAAARALEAASMPYVLNDIIDSGSFNTDSAAGKVSEENPYNVNLIHVNADQMPIFAAHKGDSYFRGRYNIGCWFWELSHFPKEWYPSFGFLHELWAPTSFIQDALSRVSPIPIVRMPLALSPELELVHGMSRSDLGVPNGNFLFLSIFDFASVLERKNPFGLIEAFKLAFNKKDNATLVLKVAHCDQYPSESESLRRACVNNDVLIMDQIFSRKEMNTLLSFCDCYVSLHRSEGFGLPIAEAMTLGKPVVVTAYSGNMDFTTPANSFLVKYNLTEIDRDYGPYRKGWVWAEPDIEHAAELMRYVYENPSSTGRVGQRARLDMAELYEPRKVCQQIKERLLRLASMGKISLPDASRHLFFEDR